MQSLLSHTCYLFEVFNEMKIEINVINYKIFTTFKNNFKNKSKSKRNFIIYHSLVKRKPHEKNRSIDYSKCEYLPDKKVYSNSNENMLFLRKTDETIWKHPLSKRTLPFN